jgi:hypothetical protein
MMTPSRRRTDIIIIVFIIIPGKCKETNGELQRIKERISGFCSKENEVMMSR